jgi:predicted peptidase
MPSKTWTLLSFAILGWLSSALMAGDEAPAPGKQVAARATVKVKADSGEQDVAIRFLLALPADYEKNTAQKWPLVLFLHGAGERGDNLELVKKHGPPRQVSEGKDFPFVLISPQCETGPPRAGWNPHALAKLVEQMANTYRVDRQRLYVTGLSMGGSGTWSLVTEYPRTFAAAIPICGRGNTEAAEKLAKMPIWVFVGAKDRAETVQNCEAMVAALKKAGGDARLKVYPDLPHDCWTVTYNNPEVFEWLLAQRLGAAN